MRCKKCGRKLGRYADPTQPCRICKNKTCRPKEQAPYVPEPPVLCTRCEAEISKLCRSGLCKPCQKIVRREKIEASKVPCACGCGRMVTPEAKTGYHHRCQRKNPNRKGISGITGVQFRSISDAHASAGPSPAK